VSYRKVAEMTKAKLGPKIRKAETKPQGRPGLKYKRRCWRRRGSAPKSERSAALNFPSIVRKLHWVTADTKEGTARK